MPTKNQFPSVLEALDEAYTNIDGAKYPYKARVHFNARLPEATRQLINNSSLPITEALVNHWINHFTYTLEQESASEIFVPDLDLFIEYVVRNNLGTRLFSNPAQANLLACLCLVRVYGRNCGNVHPKDNNVEDILKQWTGVEVPSITLRDVGSAVEFLFGKACLTLYQNDVAHEAQLPRYLWSLGLPLQYLTNKNKTPELTTSALPCNLY